MTNYKKNRNKSNLISIIVPVYNVEPYLNRCINSILNQTFNNFELVLVNDGSTDKSGIICDSFKIIDDRIIVIHKTNGGLSSARNVGIEIAKGDFIGFVDSDDWLHPKYIETLYNNLVEFEAEISICNFLKVSTETIPNNPKNHVSQFSNIEALNQLHGKLNTQFVISVAKLYKRELFNKIRFKIGKLHEDEFVIHHLLNNANKIVYTSSELYYYFQRNDSITGIGFNIGGTLNAIEALSDREELAIELNQSNLLVKIYRAEFYHYTKIFSVLEKSDIEYKTVKYNFDSLIFKLNQTNQPFLFLIKYKGYLISPLIFKSLEKIHSFLGYLKNRIRNNN